MSANLNNVAIGLSPSGEDTTSGIEFCTDRGLGQVQHHPNGIIIDSTTRDSWRNPNTTLERGLVLTKQATGRYKHYTNADTLAATDKLVIFDDVSTSVLDANGVAQNTAPRKGMIRGLVDPALVRDTAGTAVDSAGRTRLSDGINGAAMIWQG